MERQTHQEPAGPDSHGTRICGRQFRGRVYFDEE